MFRLSLFACFVGVIWLLAITADTQPGTAKVEEFRGKVVPLAEVLKKDKIELDKDAEAVSLVLEMDGGQILPLVKDIGSRAFYQDAQLLRRPMQLRGRLVARGSMLQVLKIFSLKNGKLCEVYYWCDVCAIRRDALDIRGICDCCGGKMELKEVPVEK